MRARRRTRALRIIAAPFVAAPPTGARVRTRLRPTDAEAEVLTQIGAHLGSLYRGDLAARIRLGDVTGKDANRTVRKRELTARATSRWAGSITRTAEDQYQLSMRGLREHVTSLGKAITTVDARLAAPVGGRAGRVKGYVSRQEHAAKRQRRNLLSARLVTAAHCRDVGRPAVVAGGRRLARTRHHLPEAGLIPQQWRQRWDAARMFLTADGETGAPGGNYTVGAPITVPLHLIGPASQRDGRLRNAITVLLKMARDHDCAAIAVENLGFSDARITGREKMGRGRRGKLFRRTVAGIPTARFRDRLTAMAYTVGLAVIVVDPAYSSRWGGQHWQPALTTTSTTATRHHGAAVVIARRAHGHKARRRPRPFAGHPAYVGHSVKASNGQHTEERLKCNVSYSRTLTFATNYNFRDVGGYPGIDGRTVRWRHLFRSDSLHRLKGDDLATFEELGIRSVIDLRRAHEVAEHGRIPEADGLDYHNLVIEHVDWESVPEPAGLPHERWLADRYLNFAEDGRAGLSAALTLIADPAAAPVVVHCMAGKDRTGVVCALTLALLGVSDHDIAEDYALTEVSMASLTEYLLKTKPHVVQDKYHMFNCPKDAMLLFLDDLRARYGSVPAYVREIGVSDQQVAAMRDHLLSPG